MIMEMWTNSKGKQRGGTSEHRKTKRTMSRGHAKDIIIRLSVLCRMKSNMQA
jgi:hypothetical protein